ncbi:UvrB/UvrC motif-containing protein [Amphibacillus cookii]|uniref:UvrB/UvrC motif-containing protein n=1 Tax=Amphibacillus cookii TaxID=767787 RepID=UPI00195B5FBB|nr:UvrB/UvrC motif-containing protein [Amphibacillus cookii]MBM7542887.1 protein arginine kinase activator [Amphibacillus cookii]
MECEICHENPATLHLTNYINGQKTELHVCQKCAMEKGYIEPKDDAYTIHDLLSGLFNFNSNLSNQPGINKSNQNELTCPHCKMTYHQFAKVGKFGCAHCYKTFEDHLNPIFRKVHSGNTEHTGKIPKRQHVHLQQKRLIQDYRNRLKTLIDEENFEEAAKLRDRIKALESGESSSDSNEEE